MHKTTATMIVVVFASHLLSACTTPQLVNYQWLDSPQHRYSSSDDSYLLGIVITESGESLFDDQHVAIRY